MKSCAYIAALCLLGCSDGHESFEHATPRSATTLSAELARQSPRPGAARGAWAIALNEGCVSCHAQQARAWEGSRHQRADTNAAYRTAFSKEPSPFCTSCHAPEAADPRRPSAAESELGVGCVTCHVVGDETQHTVLAGPDGAAPHALMPSVAFAANDACSNCHEFRFPGHSGHDAQAFMQTTITEAERHGEPDAACADCHMPAGDHGFAQVRDPAWLRAALAVQVHRDEDNLTLRLSQPRPGHAFPTGDLFRRLEVGVLWHDERGASLQRQTRYLARHFMRARDYHHGRKLAGDDRVTAGDRVVTFDVPEGAHHARWWVTLQRVAEVGTGVDREAATIESEVRIHEGTTP